MHFNNLNKDILLICFYLTVKNSRFPARNFVLNFLKKCTIVKNDSDRMIMVNNQIKSPIRIMIKGIIKGIIKWNERQNGTNVHHLTCRLRAFKNSSSSLFPCQRPRNLFIPSQPSFCDLSYDVTVTLKAHSALATALQQAVDTVQLFPGKQTTRKRI